MSERGLILLRTHFVDERIAEAARTYAAGGDYDVMIAVDETAGEIDTLGLPKLSLSLDSCVRLGLNVAFEKPLWRCGDYLFYHALALPRRYERIWSIEYDIALNFADPAEFFRVFDRSATEDYLTTFLEEAPAKWHWRRATVRRFPVVYSSGFALVRLSAKAAELLWRRRQLEAAELAKTKLSPAKYWLNDEAFVSSAAADLGLSSADLNAHGEVYTPQTLMRGGVWHPAQLPAPDGKIYHAVRTGSAFLAAVKSYYDFDLDAFFAFADPALPEFAEAALTVLAKRLYRVPDDPAAVFGHKGALGGLERHFSEPRVVAALLRALARRRMRVCIETVQFGRIALAFARTEESDNVALGRSAWQSSTSARARKRSLRRDAEGGNDGDLQAEYGFHTAQQEGPWWAVDLGAEFALRRVRLYNRRGAERRLRLFVIETSPDFMTWTTVYAHEPKDTSLLLKQPIEIGFDPPARARYLRIRLPRVGVLHLVEVEVFKA